MHRVSVAEDSLTGSIMLAYTMQVKGSAGYLDKKPTVWSSASSFGDPCGTVRTRVGTLRTLRRIYMRQNYLRTAPTE
jgi:hypothetical protein